MIPIKTEQSNIRVHTSTKLTPILASSNKNEGYVYKLLKDTRKKTKPKFQVNDFVRTADLSKTFSEGDRTNWLYKLHKITEFINDKTTGY